jgi:hypothetical protein
MRKDTDVRTGDILATGDSGRKMNEVYPQRYAKAEAARHRTMAAASEPAAGNTVQ